MYTSALRRLSTSDGLAGIAVELASDGNEAFARVLGTPPVDLVITDVYMPVMSGFALVEKIRSEPRLQNLPVVVISSGGAEERERVSRLGADFFLQKPVKYQDIVATVRTLLAAGGRPAKQAPSKGVWPPNTVDLVGVGGAKTLARSRGTVHDEPER
jgi:CheY-like chemotaxis protein